MGRVHSVEAPAGRLIANLGALVLLSVAVLGSPCRAFVPSVPQGDVLSTADSAGGSLSGSGDNLPPAGQAIRFYQKYISDLRHGRCRFQPSCSEYAREAIGERGLVIGAALAADRLMRCNPRARGWYERDRRGDLVDPPAGSTTAEDKPLVPAWLLFSIVTPPVPDSLREYAEFANALEDQGDCWRAATEYKRIAFLGRSPALEFWTKMRIGACYFRTEEWEEAAAEFTRAAADAPDPQARNAAWYVAAASSFNRGRYNDCRRILLEAPFDWSAAGAVAGQAAPDPEAQDYLSEYARITREKWLILSGLCTMGMGDWDGAGARFQESADGMADSPDRRRVAVLAERAGGGSGVREKHPALAGAMSAVVPGAGQVYCGRYYDGFRHLMFNGLLIGAVYQLAKEESYTGAYLVAGLELPFYLGNVIGAKRAAESTNTARRLRYLRDTIALTDR